MFAVLCATIAYWALQLLAPAVPIAPTGSLVDQRDAPDLAAAARLFGLPVGGRAGAPPAALANIQVLGVAASAVRGSAVLVVDGKPPKAYMVGDTVTADTRLVEVRSDVAVVERNGVRVELVAPQRPSVAILSGGPARADGTGAASAPPVPTVPPRYVPPPAAVPGQSAPQPAGAAAQPAAVPTPPPQPATAVQAGVDPPSPAGIRNGAAPTVQPSTQPSPQTAPQTGAPAAPPPGADGSAPAANRP